MKCSTSPNGGIVIYVGDVCAVRVLSVTFLYIIYKHFCLFKLVVIDK
jgi:hypothetical protein